MAFKSTDLRRGHIPGEDGLWFLIFGDLMVFSAFFIMYAVSRSQSLALFRT